MAKAKFDPNAAFQSIVGQAEKESDNAAEVKKTKKSSKTNRIQKAYFFDKDLIKALQYKTMAEEINLTDAINDALRIGLQEYLEKVGNII